MPDSIFLRILNMSFTASFAIFFVLVIRLLLKKAPKLFSYTLWGVVLFRLLCPFSFESTLSLLPVNAVPVTSEIFYAATPQISTGLAPLDNMINPILPAAIPSASINPLQIWLLAGEIVWLTGFAVLALYSIISLLRLKQKQIGAVRLYGNIYLADHIVSPFVLGVLQPKIYLPSTLPQQERDYIILHEQTHIRRCDHIIKIAAFTALCLHWFNPLVWAAFILSVRDMEMSCDESVLKKLGDGIRGDYSASLLSLATGRKIIAGSPLAFGEGDTKCRVKNILNYKKPAFWAVPAATAAVICVIAGLISNPKDIETGFGGVNALILKIDKSSQTVTVKGMDENSVIGDNCIITWEKDALITVTANNERKPLTIDDFSDGDSVVLFIGEVQESYPTRANATTIQLLPNAAEESSPSAESTDNRTRLAANANYSQYLTSDELKQTGEIARNYFTIEAPYYEGVVSIELVPDDSPLYQNTGIEGEYSAGNIIIYKVLTVRDEKDGNPARSVSIARSTEDSNWEIINHGY